MTELELLIILAGPFGLALVVSGLWYRPWNDVDEIRSNWLLAPVTALSYLVGHLSVTSFPPFPARTVDEWLIYAAIAAGIWGLVEALADGMPRVVVHLGRLILFGGALWIMAGQRLGLALFLGLSAAMFVSTAIVELASEKVGSPLTLWVLSIVAGASGASLVLGSSLKLAILAWSLMAALMAWALIYSFMGAIRELRVGPVIALVSILVTGLFVSGVLYAQTPLQSALGIVGAALISLGIGVGATAMDWGRWKRAAVVLLTAVVIASGSVGYTYYDTRLVEEEVDEDDYDPYTW